MMRRYPVKRERATRGAIQRGLALGAMGLEAEFTVLLDGQAARPEDVFGSPTAFVRQPMMHRAGRSYHLPTGGAVYFDTGVIEVATPLIEIAPGCAARAGRSLWESIRFVRQELDAWEDANQHEVQLVGFSAHYNVSFDVPAAERRRGRTVEHLALLLTHILPFPVMLLAANRLSTGVGVRPRGNRVEITADFTPDPALMIAAATLIVGVVRDVMTWRRFTHEELDEHELPRVRGFQPVPHSSRKGWVARYSCFARNPFQCDVDAAVWKTTSGESLTLRELAARVTEHFWPSIRRLGDPRSLRLIREVMDGRGTSMLEMSGRPRAYEQVGRLARWDNLFTERQLARSRYERVLLHAIAGHRLRVGSELYAPVAVRGWSHVVFRRERDRARRVWSLDEVLARADRWERRRRPRLKTQAPAPPAPVPDDTATIEQDVPPTPASEEKSMRSDIAVMTPLTPVREPEVASPPAKRPRRQPPRRRAADRRGGEPDANP
jgi:hypothetical protein